MAIAQESEWQPLDAPPGRHLEIETDREPAVALAAVRDGLDAQLRSSAANYARTRRG